MSLGFGLGLQYSKLSGGGSSFDPQAQAQITRITNAGGTIEDANVIDADIKFLKSIGLFANLKYAVDTRAGIMERVDGSDTFASKIFDYSGSDADTANATGSAQPKKGILNGVTSLDFDGVDDKLTDEDTVTLLAGEEMFSIAVYAQDFTGSDTFGQIVDKFSPNVARKSFGKSGSSIGMFSGGSVLFTPYQNVQIIASGTADTDDLLTGFINNVQINQETFVANYVGKTLGNLRESFGKNKNAKAQFQKNWDFNALPTESQAEAINTYLINQFNIHV
jgi:molybdopterin converting factor small subunit